MSLFLLSVGLISFILYFYGIGLRYLGLLPIIFFASFISYHGLTISLKIKGSEMVEKYSLCIVWLFILAGITGVLNFFHVQLIQICFALIAINIALWIGSYFTNYKDGKLIFQGGYYFSLLFLLGVGAAFSNSQDFLKIFTYLWTFNFAIIGFITFLIGIWHEVEKSLHYQLFIFGIGAIILTIIHNVPNLYLALAISIVLLTGIFCLIFKILQHNPGPKNQKSNISVRRILAGERITQPKKYFSSKFSEGLYNFVHDMPNFTKFTLEGANIILIFTIILSYLFHQQILVLGAAPAFSGWEHLLYRIIIGFFIGNALILKKVGYNSILQNLAIFLVINFAIYLSLFSYFEGHIGSIVARGMIRNLASSILIFYAPKRKGNIFKKIDYLYRMLAMMSAMLINIVLLMKTGRSGELIFFLTLLYLGIQGTIFFYAFQSILKLEDPQV